MANSRRPNATYIPLAGVGGWRFLGLASGKTQKICVTQRQRYQHVGIFCVG